MVILSWAGEGTALLYCKINSYVYSYFLFVILIIHLRLYIRNQTHFVLVLPFWLLGVVVTAYSDNGKRYYLQAF